MGIKHFFYWYKNQFPEYIKSLKKDESFLDLGVKIDNLMLDMNGIYHNSAQKIYQYGNYKPQKRLLGRGNYTPIQNKQNLVFKDVCESVDQIVKITKPEK